MADITWIKLRIDMFDDEKIKLIQALPDGDTILVIWIRILALAGKCNANGYLCIDDEFPYSDEMLATIFNKTLPQVRLALDTFSRFGMIEKTQKGVYISNFMEHQNADGMERIREQNRLRKHMNSFFFQICHVTRHATRHKTFTKMSREVTQQREKKK